MTLTPLDALAALEAGKFQRYAVPGKWRVFWHDGLAVLERLQPSGTSSSIKPG